MTTGQAKQPLPEVNRRARTSAAMIGLAISMGAHSLLLPKQSDSAMAAEPVAPESTLTAVPAPLEIAALSPGNEVGTATVGFSQPDAVVEHTVQEGQTLWQLAQLYQVSPAVIASANGVSLDSVLHVGQTLKIPTGSQSGVEVVTNRGVEVASQLPTYSAPLTVPAPVTADANPALKREETAALERLKQKRDALRAGLTELKADQQLPEPELPEISVDSPSTALEQVAESANAAKSESKSESKAIAYQPSSPTLTPSIKAASPELGETVNYRVKVGDTVEAIARRHGVTRAELVRLNGLSNPNYILVNQVLKVPQRAADSGTQASTVIPSLPPTSSATVTVASSSPSVPVASQFSSAPSADVSAVPVLPTTEEQAVPSVDIPLAVGGSQQEFKGSVAAVPVQLPSLTQSAPTTSQHVPVVEPNARSLQIAAISSNPPVRLNSEIGQSRYIENLRVEIVKLREKYESQRETPSTQKQAETAAPSSDIAVRSDADSLPTVSRQINPEFRPDQRVTAPAKAETQTIQTQSESASKPVPASTARESKRQLVATAPLGSESYEPILQSSLGQMVSPDLPPIGGAEAYLPDGTPQSKGYIWPAKGLLTSGYGWRWGRMHRGIDIAAPIGTPVVAAATGVVVTAGWNSGGYGNLVEVRHPDGSLTLYAHNNRILVRPGQQVQQGQQIAEMGSTGYSTGPHSHFEVHLPGQGAVNPIAYLPRSRNS